MEKYTKGEATAVIYSPGYGAGWYSWNTDNVNMLFCPELVEAILSGDETRKQETAEKLFPEAIYDGLRVEWVPTGQNFSIDECDGNERVITADNLRITA